MKSKPEAYLHISNKIINRLFSHVIFDKGRDPCINRNESAGSSKSQQLPLFKDRNKLNSTRAKRKNANQGINTVDCYRELSAPGSTMGFWFFLFFFVHTLLLVLCCVSVEYKAFSFSQINQPFLVVRYLCGNWKNTRVVRDAGHVSGVSRHFPRILPPIVSLEESRLRRATLFKLCARAEQVFSKTSSYFPVSHAHTSASYCPASNPKRCNNIDDDSPPQNSKIWTFPFSFPFSIRFSVWEKESGVVLGKEVRYIVVPEVFCAAIVFLFNIEFPNQ